MIYILYAIIALIFIGAITFLITERSFLEDVGLYVIVFGGIGINFLCLLVVATSVS